MDESNESHVSSLDPRVAISIRAEFFRCVANEPRFHATARRRQELLAWLEENGWIDTIGLRLRNPVEEMPWTRGVIHGSWLHWNWTARHAMYPASLSTAIDSLAKGDQSGAEECLLFLEADPWCDSSGYVKQDIVRYFRRVTPLYRQAERLLDALLIPVFVGPRIEFRQYCRTARAFATPDFHSRLRSLAGNPRFLRTGVEQRALWMLQAIERE